MPPWELFLQSLYRLPGHKEKDLACDHRPHHVRFRFGRSKMNIPQLFGDERIIGWMEQGLVSLIVEAPIPRGCSVRPLSLSKVGMATGISCPTARLGSLEGLRNPGRLSMLILGPLPNCLWALIHGPTGERSGRVGAIRASALQSVRCCIQGTSCRFDAWRSNGWII
jgi:hypothetical protein